MRELFFKHVSNATGLVKHHELENLWEHFKESMGAYLQDLNEETLPTTLNNWLLYVNRYSKDPELMYQKVQESLNLTLGRPCQLSDNVIRLTPRQ